MACGVSTTVQSTKPRMKETELLSHLKLWKCAILEALNFEQLKILNVFFPDTFCSKLESSTCFFARKIHLPLLKDTVWLVRLKMCTTYSSSPTRSSPNSMLIFFHLGDDSNVFPPLVPFFFCTVLLAFVLIAALKNQNNKVAFTWTVLNALDFTWHSQD